MLKDQIDFDYNIEKLNEKLDLNINLQDEILDSYKINTTFKSIENDLNKLYEKTRYLEESIDYAKTFVSLKIDTYSSNINSIIKSIEDITRVSKNLGYIEYNVPFKKNTFSINDRNINYKIEPCKIKNVVMDESNKDIIMLDSRVNSTVKYNSLNKKCEQMAYDGDLNNLLEDKEYRSIYLEEKPINKGIVETITVYLSEPTEINELDINSINSSVNNVRFVYANGIEEQSGSHVTGVESKSRVVTHIKFDLACKNYNTVVYELETEEITKNVWNYIKLTELYNGEIPPNKLVAAIEQEKENSKDDTTPEEEIDSSILVSRTYTSSNNTTDFKAYKKASTPTKKITMYTYNFGIDNLKINRIVQYEDGYFISDPINIGNLNEKEYIQLDVEDCQEEFCSIEYYLLDGDKEIPMMPISCKFIDNEKIFPEVDLRFLVDFNIHGDGLKQIKKDGLNVSISLDDAKKQYDGRYSADYLPVYEYYKYTPLNNNIKVKAIIRTYGDTIPTNPYIKSINIRKYGGEALWTTLY